MNPATGDENAHYQTAQRLAAAGALAEAVGEYAAAIESEPTQLKAICGRGLALQRLGRHPEAIQEFDRLLVLNRDWVGVSIVHYGRALSLFLQGQIAESIVACNETLQIEVAHVEARYLRGVAHQALGQLDEAFSDIRETLLRDPTHLGAAAASGKLNILKGNYLAAVDDFTSAIALAPSDSLDVIDCLRFRGIGLQSLARHTEAIENFTRVIALQPHDASTYLRRAHSYEALGRVDLSKADLERGKELLKAT